MDTKPALKVTLVDESKLFRTILAGLLTTQGGFEISTVQNEEALFSLLKEQQPDIIIFDLYAAAGNIQAMHHQLKEHAPLAKTIFFSFDTQEVLVEECLRQGVKGFFDKTIADISLLAQSIRKVAEGEVIVLTPENA